jgi:hypothetical protein
VLCGSASKAYAMTGWRCGWALAPAEVIAACNAVQSHSTSNVCSITQKATTAALVGPQACVGEMLDEYRRRRDQLCEWLAREPRLRVQKPAGAFYLFIDVSDVLNPDGLRPPPSWRRRCSTKRASRSRPGKRSTPPASCACRMRRRWRSSSAASIASLPFSTPSTSGSWQAAESSRPDVTSPMVNGRTTYHVSGCFLKI